MSPPGLAALHGHIHDVLLFYTKGPKWTWNPIYTPYDAEYLDAFYHVEAGTGRRFRLGDLTAALEEVPVIGQPTEVEGARQLAQSPEGRYQFQWWALNLVDAKPVGGVEKKGADRGIDGLLTFTDTHGELETVLVSVKSGHVNSGMIRDLKGTLDREKGAIGLFVTLEEPSREMRLEADTAGLYHSRLWNRDYPKLQLLSIRELLEEGKKSALPPFVLPTYQRAAAELKASGQQEELFGQSSQ